MFYTIHKIIIRTFWALIILAGVILYQKRAVFQPLVDLVEIAKQIEFHPQQQHTIGELSGQVTQITAADTFRVKDERGSTYHLRFHGLDIPQQWNPADKRARELREETKQGLSQLILSNQVKVEMVSTNATHGGLGIVYLNNTNVNLKLVEMGLAKINREYLKTLPVKEQYAFLIAQKKAEERELGIWK